MEDISWEISFPHDDALTKKLFLEIQNVMQKWTIPLAKYVLTISPLAIMYESKFNLASI